MKMRTIKQIKQLVGKRVLVRVDFNVPLKKKQVVDDSRLKAVLPTIKFLQEKKAKIILVTHLGRPEGKMSAALKIDPIREHLENLLAREVKKIDTRDWQLSKKQKDSAEAAIDAMLPGDIVMLENIRFSPHEQKATASLSRELASLADIFVLDGFAVAHRADASVAGVAKRLPAYAGLLLEKEIAGLTKVMKKPNKPFVAIIGGAKMETKIPVIQKILPNVTYLLVGGGIVNTYLKAMKYGVGASLVDEKLKKQAVAYGKKKKVILPVDVVVGKSNGKGSRVVTLGKKPHAICGPGEAIFDIGPTTIRLYATYIKRAETLVWNGAMGYFEQKPYHHGTLAMARLVASRSQGEAFGVIGGGETLQAMDQVGMGQYVDLISTGGGAMLEFLAGKKLPGVVGVTK